jgi:hypothetical protein
MVWSSRVSMKMKSMVNLRIFYFGDGRRGPEYGQEKRKESVAQLPPRKGAGDC